MGLFKMLKASKQLRGALVSVVAVAVCFSLVIVAWNSTYAWFSENKQVAATGMQVKADVTANLIISDSETEIAKAAWVGINKGSPFAVASAVAAGKIVPATHAAVSAENPMGLLYLPNTYGVDPEVGTLAEGSVLQPVPVWSSGTSSSGTDAKRCYIDYTVYIAATDKPLTATLTATLIPPAGDLPDTFKAASVDFYVGDAYKGTLNLAGLDPANSGAALTSVALIENGEIPQNTSGHLTVTLRAYFDGNLEDPEAADEITFVRTRGVELTALTGLGVHFAAVE